MLREFLAYLKRNPAVWIIPAVFVALAVALAVYVMTRPVAGTAIYKP